MKMISGMRKTPAASSPIHTPLIRVRRTARDRPSLDRAPAPAGPAHRPACLPQQRCPLRPDHADSHLLRRRARRAACWANPAGVSPGFGYVITLPSPHGVMIGHASSSWGGVARRSTGPCSPGEASGPCHQRNQLCAQARPQQPPCGASATTRRCVVTVDSTCDFASPGLGSACHAQNCLPCRGFLEMRVSRSLCGKALRR